MATSPDAVADDDLWARHADAPTPALRDTLVKRYERLVRILAAKAYARRFSIELEFDDYFQFGMVGLLESIDRYRPGEGARFETFASRRVAGAILDGVESLSEKQQQIASRQRALRERAASVHEPATTARHDVLDRLGDTAVALALGLLLEDSGVNAGASQTLPDNSYARLELRQLQQRIREAVKTLPAQERSVLSRHYFQQCPFDQIADELQLTRGRISQIHRAALDRLRAGWRDG